MVDENVNVVVTNFSMEEVMKKGTEKLMDVVKEAKSLPEVAFTIATMMAELELAGFVITEEQMREIKKQLLIKMAKA